MVAFSHKKLFLPLDSKDSLSMLYWQQFHLYISLAYMIGWNDLKRDGKRQSKKLCKNFFNMRARDVHMCAFYGLQSRTEQVAVDAIIINHNFIKH